jgi:outer membrane lipoprotein SlyB
LVGTEFCSKDKVTRKDLVEAIGMTAGAVSGAATGAAVSGGNPVAIIAGAVLGAASGPKNPAGALLRLLGHHDL